MALTLAARPASAQAALASDQPDYAPNSTAILMGMGFAPGEPVVMHVIRTDDPNSADPEYQPWLTTANEMGDIAVTWHVCDCPGAVLIATADGVDSQLHAETTFTDAPSCNSGTGVVTSVTGNGGSCADFTPAQGSGPDNWEVAPGGSYTMTISGVTECSGDTITVFIQSSVTGNFCFNATGGNGTYVGTFDLTADACLTLPISYKCGADAGCNNAGNSAIAARGPSGACTVHLRSSTFDENCVRTGDACGGCNCGMPIFDNQSLCTTGVTHFLGCNPETVPSCDPNVTAHDNCGPAGVVCGYQQGSFGCIRVRRVVYTAVNSCGDMNDKCDSLYQWREDTMDPSISEVPGESTIECPAVPVFAEPTASDNCAANPQLTLNDVTTLDACGYTVTRTWTAEDNCHNTSSTSQIIHVLDTVRPVIDPAPPALQFQCVGDVPDAEPLGATDGCSGSLIALPTDSPSGDDCNLTIVRTWNVMDGCGNAALPVVQIITVEDTIPPTFNAPPPIELEGNGECCIPISNLGPRSGTDNCDGTVSVEPSLPEGSCFPVGVTTISWSAHDACGNAAELTVDQLVTVRGQICIEKFYDANANGVWDREPFTDTNGNCVWDDATEAEPAEPFTDTNSNGSWDGENPIANWPFVVIDSNGEAQNVLTDDCGIACVSALPGLNSVTEDLPSSWTNTTGGASVTVVVDAEHCNQTVSFGNYCSSNPAGGRTLGFWSNKNGKAILKSMDPTWRADINALYLVNGNGSSYQVPGGDFESAYANFRTWILGATGHNMAHMLSAQLAATVLDTSYYGLDVTLGVRVSGCVTGAGQNIVSFLSQSQALASCGGALLTQIPSNGTAPCGCALNDGFVTIADLQARASCLLMSVGGNTTVATGLLRTYEECVKDILDMINNNGNNGYACGGVMEYINSGPCN